MSENKLHFHLTLGPVQGFIAQARRTRDFWAGSFILSWLAAVAMKSVQRQGAQVVFPVPDAAFMAALTRGGSGPQQANVPSRFMARVGEGFSAKQVEQDVREAWRQLADWVWTQDLQHLDSTSTRKIWNTQIAGFWDIQWALVDDPAATNILDRLKNWRTHLPPEQGGVKCMMMDGWSELSGQEAPGQEVKQFWSDLRERAATLKTDLRPGEFLCAMAFVKRHFARHFANFQTTLPSGLDLHGWELPNGVPSTHYLAAAHWLEELLNKSAHDNDLAKTVEAFHKKAYRLTGQYGEWQSNIRCVREAPGSRNWKALDGTVFFDSMLENPRLWGNGKGGAEADEARQLSSDLNALRKTAKLDPISPYYAILLMDGDSLGENMSDPQKQPLISQSLARFTEQVPAVVACHNGFLVYAGGDDVLALLPLEDALPCAAELRRVYMGCFDLAQIATSLSGAIEYVHIKTPLGKVLADAHQLLDDVAKDGRGRDAIACRVWNPGGLAVEWAMPWHFALDNNGNVILKNLVDQFLAKRGSEQADLAGKYFYRLRDLFELIAPGRGSSGLDDGAVLDLLASAYLNSGLIADKKLGMDYARQRITPLFEQCRMVVREKDQAPDTWPRIGLQADAALLLRFLANKGVQR